MIICGLIELFTENITRLLVDKNSNRKFQHASFIHHLLIICSLCI